MPEYCDVLLVVPLLIVTSIRHLLCNTSAYFFLIMKAFLLFSPPICVILHILRLCPNMYV